MKKTLIIMLSALMLALLCACGGTSGQSNKAPALNVGETASTDIFDLTLEDATFAIALENSCVPWAKYKGNSAYGDGDAATVPFLLPKEYDAEDEANNPFVAPKGHTLVAFTITVKNNDRVAQELYEGGESLQFVSVAYNGAEFAPVEAEWGMEIAEDGSWEVPSPRISNVYVNAGESTSYRMYADVEVEPESLADGFEMTFAVPNSEGGTESFTYTVGQ